MMPRGYKVKSIGNRSSFNLSNNEVAASGFRFGSTTINIHVISVNQALIRLKNPSQ